MIGRRSAFAGSLLVYIITVSVCVLLVSNTCAQINPNRTQIVDMFYYSEHCSGPSTNTSKYAGDCFSLSSHQSSEYYCSEDGSIVFQYIYSNSSCDLSSLTLVSASATTCELLLPGMQRMCVNASLGPSPPTPFPPTDWIQSTECMNVTDPIPEPSQTCSSGGDPEIHCMGLAVPMACRAYEFAGSKLYTQFGCNAEGTAVGRAMFIDDTCSTLVAIQTSPAGCHNGVEYDCQESMADPLPTLPMYGQIQFQFQEAHCNATNPPILPSTLLYAPGACVGSRMYQCEKVDEVVYGVLSQFSDPTDTGQCVGVPTNTTQIAGECVNGLIFLCDGEEQQAKVGHW